jgi:hypothetical protein
MIIDNEILLLGIFFNKMDENGEYVAGVGVELSDESFSMCCDAMYSHLVQEVGHDDRWTFLLSVMYSVLESIRETHPQLISAMEVVNRPIFKHKP